MSRSILISTVLLFVLIASSAPADARKLVRGAGRGAAGGALIGALSYRLGGFPKDAIAGVTPIGDILDARREVENVLIEAACDGKMLDECVVELAGIVARGRQAAAC